MMRLVLYSLFVFLVLPAPAQDFSNKGRDFFIAYPAHYDSTASVMGIYITSDVNASGTIRVGATTLPFTVTANQVTRKFLGTGGAADAGNSDVYLDMADGLKSNAAIRVTADKPVVVYTHIIRSARSGATLALPTGVLGIEYIAPSYQNTGSSDSYGEVAVVATQPATIIEITPTVAGRSGRVANAPFTVTLPNAGDVYQFQGALNADISGTRIRSIAAGGTGGCKPVAVFSATTWSAFDCLSASGGDNLYQQLFPLRTWGKKFINAPFANRQFDMYRIFIADPATVVNVNIQGVPFPLAAGSFNANGKYYTIKTPYPLSIEADKPVSVVQYITSQLCKAGCTSANANLRECLADPEMVILSPLEQTLSEVTFFSAHQNYVPPGQTQVTEHWVNIVVNKKYKGSVKIDNALVPAASFTDIPGSAYAYLQQDITASSAVNPVHRITADTSFSALVYGYGVVESYGYNAGTNVRDLYQYVTIRNQYAAINFPATCKDAPFFFSITLPYLTSSLTWDFNGNPALSPNVTVVNNAPVPDSSFVKDGRTLYVYRLAVPYTFSATGTYPVRVLANNLSPEGCSGVQEINYDVEVYPAPVADFTVSHSGCSIDTVYFNDVSDGNVRQVINRKWDFGDLTTDTTKVPSKLYTAAGSYNVSLRVITDIGCLGNTSKPIIINPTPIAKFGTDNIHCLGTTTFYDSSSAIGGTIAAWKWNFDNNDSIINNSNIAPQRNYTPGAYTITLRVQSDKGCNSKVYTKAITVNPSPQVNFSLPVVCLNDAFALFTDSSTISDGSYSSFAYLWNFDDPNAIPPNQNTSTVKNPQHKYAASGIYNISLTTTSDQGCAVSVTKPFTVNGAVPDAQFDITNAASLCSNNNVQLVNKSTVDFGAVTKLDISWDNINDPSNSITDPAPAFNKMYSYSYPALQADKNYEIKMRAFSGGSCVDELVKTITVHASPKVVFDSIGSFCVNSPAVQINAPANGNVAGSGEFSGPGISSSGVFTPVIAGAGNHAIQYVYTSANGCKDSATALIVVLPAPMVNAGPDLFVMEGDEVMLKPQVSTNNPSYLWTPSAYLNNDTIMNPVSKPLADVTYKITATGQDGCKGSDEVIIKLLKSLRIPNAFSPNGDGVNDYWNIEHLESYAGAVVEVFNRHGQRVFFTNRYTKAWDGTYKGKPLPVGTYYYVIEPKNGRSRYSGSVTVLR